MASSHDDLLRLMQAGDMLAIDVFAREYGQTLMHLARRQCHLPADAEDAVQQALETASTSMTGIRGEGSPVAWLSTLVARNCYRMNKQAARDDGLADGEEVPCTCDDPEVVAERSELASTLGEGLMQLKRTDRLIFLLSVEGLNSLEIAERFELSHDAVRSRLKRARGHLRECIEKADTPVGPERTTGHAHSKHR